MSTKLIAPSLWRLLPWVTFGLATPVLFIQAGSALQSWVLRYTGTFYGVLLLLAVVPAGTNLPLREVPYLPGWARLALFAGGWIGGAIHATVAAPRLHARAMGRPSAVAPAAGGPAGAGALPAGPAHGTADPVAVAEGRLRRRGEAKEILAKQPDLAQELRIGRPDLPRTYDDGGLVDVNHVPAEVLIGELELAAAQVARIIDERALLGGFGSADELVVYCGLAPDRLAVIRDRLVFVAY